MNLVINRLDPNVPDPVESRRRAAGRLVRLAYATIVFGVLAFIVVYFGRPLLYLGGPGRGHFGARHCFVSLCRARQQCERDVGIDGQGR